MVKQQVLPGARGGAVHGVHTPIAPEKVTLEVTSRCSLGCIMCPREKMKRPLADMAWETFEQVVRMIRPVAPLEELDLTGFGEPLERADLVLDMLARVEKRRLAKCTRVTTNGTLLAPALIDKLMAFKTLTLEVSVLAVRPQAYLLVTGQNALARVETHLEHFFKKRRELKQDFPRLVIKSVRMEGLEGEFGEFLDRWKGKADEVVAENYHRWGGAAPKLRPQESAERYPCPHIFSTMVVSQDGRVSPCDVDFDRRLAAAHVNDGLDEAWRSESLEELRRAHLEGRWDELPKCKSCDYWAESPDPRVAMGESKRAA